MKARLVRIGNSRGIRIPKPLIDQVGLADEVEIEVEDDRLVVRSAKRPRSGWAKAFKAMAEGGDDTAIDAAAWPATRWDAEEWEWR